MSYQSITARNTLFKKYKIGCWIIFILALGGNFSVFATNMPDSQELIKQLGIQQQDLASLNQGEIVFFNVAESDEKELAAGAAIYLPTAPSKIIRFIKKKGLASIDTAVTARGTIPTGATLNTFKGFSTGKDEAVSFLTATAGSQFNLSSQELLTIKAPNSGQTDAASKTYRKILWQRWQAYRKKGLKGIATYDRGDGTEANPEEELRKATLDSKVLTRYFPELYKALLNYPSPFPVGTEEKFFWLNREVQSRPTAILVHRVMLSVGTGEVIISRQFYAGHSYNSNQLTLVCLPYRDGSLVFYMNRTFTDQVAGNGSSLKHSIGDIQERDEMVKLLKNLRKAI
jgi:hypothetical protein